MIGSYKNPHITPRKPPTDPASVEAMIESYGAIRNRREFMPVSSLRELYRPSRAIRVDHRWKIGKYPFGICNTMQAIAVAYSLLTDRSSQLPSWVWRPSNSSRMAGNHCRQ